MLQKFRNKFFIAICSGALCALAFAPFHFFIAAIISISTFYFLVEKKSSNIKQAAILGFCYGFGYFLAGLYWISISLLVDAAKFAWLIPFALTLVPSVLALYFSALAASYKKLNSKFHFTKNHQKILLFAMLWMLFEVLRSVLFTGFPWNLIGYSLMFSDATIQTASIFGIHGLGFFATLFCLTPILLIQYFGSRKSPSKSDKIFAVILLTLFIGNIIFGYQRLQNTKIIISNESKLRLVQGNIEQDMKWNPGQKYRNFIKHVELTNAADKENIAAVIWSETAVPYIIDDNAELLSELQKAVPQNGVLITGALRVEYSQTEPRAVKNVWNSVFTLDKNGVANYYDKHHLVPFGEYIPFAKYLPFIDKITGGGGEGFAVGNGPQTLAANSFSFSPLICYEVIFSDKIINKKNRPDLLVNVTNDAWFGTSSGPFQHFDMSKMRAVEYGIPLARVANTGISAFVDPLGRVLWRINLNQEGFIDVNLVNKLDATIFSRFNYWPLILVVLAIIGLLSINVRKK